LAALRLDENIEHPLVASKAATINKSSKYFIYGMIPQIKNGRHGVLPAEDVASSLWLDSFGHRPNATPEHCQRAQLRQRINWPTQMP
jgi:hypothetical protein